jgi:hemerythrin-like domain-containing protein
MQLEEELFYPAVKPLLKEDKDLIAEAKIEHKVAKDLIADLERASDGEQRDATFTVLCEYINHHVEEEEEELFPKISRTRADLSDLAHDMRQRKHELSQEYRLEEEEERAKPGHAPERHRGV